ncbi:MAG: glycosyltransferase family 4 protein [Smithellaceae bacterium]
MHIAGIANGFRSLGHTVSFVSPAGIDPTYSFAPGERHTITSRNLFAGFLNTLADRLPQLFFEILELLYNVFAVFRLSREIRSSKPDLLYERHAFFNIAGALCSQCFDLPIIIEVNELAGFARVREQCLVGLARKCERYIFRRAKLITAVSEFLSERIRSVPSSNAPVITIPNGVGIDWFDRRIDQVEVEDLRQSIGLTGKRVICFVGGLVPWHNFDLVLQVLASLIADRNEVALLLVGDGPLKTYILSKSQELEIEHAVHLTGQVAYRDVPKYISLSTVTVIPETNDYRSPIKLFEYMAMAKPVVAPRKPAIEIVITDGKEGVLFEPGDCASFLCALSCVLSNPDRARAMGMAGKEKVREQFLWEQHASRLLSAL